MNQRARSGLGLDGRPRVTPRPSSAVDADPTPATAVDAAPLVVGLVALTVALCAITVVAQAWLSDDAVISLRAVANTIVGNGATFNVLERVQVYSHPLWFLLLLAGNTLVYDPIVVAIGLGVAGALAYLGILTKAAWHRSWALAAALPLVLASSPAFVEWSTSGLENSLGYLLFALLLAVVTPRLGAGRPGAYVALGLVAAAIVLTRFDLAVLAGPMVLGALWQARAPAWPRALVGPALATVAAVVPVAAWFAGSIAYYGYALPNTAYAKLNLDIPMGEVVFRGVNYLRIFALRQPLSLALLVLTVALLVVEARRGRWDRAGIAVGLVLYLGYVVYLGGDFMEGRFLAVPVAVAALALATSPSVVASPGVRTGLPALLAGVALVSAVAPVTTPWLGDPVEGPEVDHEAAGTGGVSDERGYYVSRGMGFWSLGDEDRGDHPTHLQTLREAFRDWERVEPAEVTGVEVACGGIGRFGMLEGPTVHLVDACGLVDPTMARVPYEADAFVWRAGHYARAVPDGYPQAALTGDASLIQDPEVRAVFTSLHPRVRVAD